MALICDTAYTRRGCFSLVLGTLLQTAFYKDWFYSVRRFLIMVTQEFLASAGRKNTSNGLLSLFDRGDRIRNVNVDIVLTKKVSSNFLSEGETKFFQLYNSSPSMAD